MGEFRHKIWDAGKIMLGATAGYFFRAYRDKEEYKRARIGIFKGSALIFATYMVFNSVAPRCTSIIDEYSRGNQRIEEKKLDQEFQRDTMKIKRGLINEQRQEDINKQFQQGLEEKINPLYDTQKEMTKKIDPIYNSQNEIKQGLGAVVQQIDALNKKIETKPAQMNYASPTSSVIAQSKTPAGQLDYYEITLDKSESEVILSAVYSNKSRQQIGVYPASRPVNITPDGVYSAYKTTRLSNDRAPGYIYFNENNPNCGIAGSGLDSEHDAEIQQRKQVNRNGWRVTNDVFNFIYEKIARDGAIVRVQN